MHMKKAIPGALVALLLATLACSIFVGGPAYPGDLPAGTGTAVSLQEQLANALTQGAPTGVISLQITEGQLTEFLVQKLAQQKDPLLTDPRVYLRNGQMMIFGKAKSGIFTANVAVTVQATVDPNGQPQISIVQTDLGPIAAPQGFNEALAASIQEAFTGSIGPIATGFRLETITIGDGFMTVTGRFK